jgi:valine--pyruvate aminotransferase
MKLSTFGKKFSQQAGIISLMEDLGNALADGDMIMMGGGNPGFVPEVETALRESMLRITSDEASFRRLVGVYDPPQGEKTFIKAMAALLRERFDWPVGPEHIALTNGSQSAFFMLFNLFAGDFDDGIKRRILLPMTPEYIGYADAGLAEDFFVSVRPLIDEISEHTFKYRVDFDSLPLDDSIGAMCVSRPTNPTGNVLTDDEMRHLVAIAREKDIPLILDGAYGLPFPNLVFTDVNPVWDDHMILCLSLSKLGLPAARTGIVIAQPAVIKALASVNAIMNLAPGSLGAMLVTDLVQSGRILELSDTIVKPFYQAKALQAFRHLNEELQGLPYSIHVPEGAMFLWLWLKDLPISNFELYQRLKAKGVLVVSGHYFFPGLQEPWEHTRQCLRITYSQDDATVRRGLTLLAEEVRAVYSGGNGLAFFGNSRQA